MSAVSQIARAWLDWTVAASWQIALLVCLIAVLTYLLRDASPRLRYGLWMLVLVKALLPPTIAAFWGVGAWGVAPVVEYDWGSRGGQAQFAPQTPQIEPVPGEETSTPLSAEGLLLFVWAAGCLLLWTAVAWRYRRLLRLTHSMLRIEEGPARVELERLARHFSLKTVPELYATDEATSPMLVGVLHPKIVLPASVLTRLQPDELRMVLAHELVHWRRYDTWVGWLQVFVQGVFWFHPLVWLANARIRHERECACDETVLREARCDSEGYGETIVRVLTASRGRSLVMANMVGVFERGSSLQTRLEEIMNFDPTRRRFNWLSRLALVAAALVLLPMAVPGVQVDNASDPSTGGVATQQNADGEDAAARRPTTNWPTIVSTTPKIGATDVDPNLDAISVTFDRDMDVTGYSWTGSGPSHPPTPPGATPLWINKRTGELPVKLKKGTFYRVGINSTSYQNFRSALGVPAPTSAIYFCTAGAPRAMTNRVRVPKVVKMSPENGATDIDPGLKMIRVTFDMPMDSGFSWTGGGPTYPTVPQGQKPRWSPDGKTCLLPVELKPGTQYEVGLNSVHHKNFGSKWGVPLEPVHYEFRTAGEALAATTDAPPVDRAGPPRIVKMSPENGAADVDPGLTAIEVTFDRPMAGSFSWTGGGEHFPSIPEGQKPSWSPDKKTCKLPVTLKPNWQYRLGLNSPSFKNFASEDGVPLEPVVYEFRTRE